MKSSSPPCDDFSRVIDLKILECERVFCTDHRRQFRRTKPVAPPRLAHVGREFKSPRLHQKNSRLKFLSELKHKSGKK